MKKFLFVAFASVLLLGGRLKAENVALSSGSLERIGSDILMEEQVRALSFYGDRDYLLTEFFTRNREKFFTYDLIAIKDGLAGLSDAQLMTVTGASYKDPTIALVLSVLLGGLGVDRMYVGDVGLGILKLVTAGGLGIWWIVDMFNIEDRAREENFAIFNEAVYSSKLVLPVE